MKMNIKLLVLISVLIIDFSVYAFGPEAFQDFEKHIISLIGAGTGAGALAMLGVQKGIMLGKKYEKSVGAIAIPIGALFGGLTGIAAGGFMGVVVTLIGFDVAIAIKNKMNEAKSKFEEMKQQYYKIFWGTYSNPQDTIEAKH